MFIFSDMSEVNCVYVRENVFTMLSSCVAIAGNLREGAAAKRMLSFSHCRIPNWLYRSIHT